MADLLKKISEDENIAFHSEVTMKNNEKKHIPLIDMNTPSEAILEKLQNYLGENLYKKISWYKSGRSFHGYMEDMVEFKEWTQIMGRLLLCNQKNMAQTVDPRWIGHRLLAGYAALRWTKNGLHYIALPEKI
ncbi:hypothetical protein [Chromobacterium sp.]|uniref:primase 1D-like protein n=1 Tax=Chromobacterium sp. TaxID=306190 RepID=UPI0035AF8C01